MNIRRARFLLCAGLLWCSEVAVGSGRFLTGEGVRSWQELRDEGLVRQQWDFSCGAASLATIMNHYYGLEVAEIQLLEDMGKTDLRASFEDMAKVLSNYGLRGLGVKVDFDQLLEVTMPVILYLNYHGDDHFSVLRGIDENQVWLADSALGNRRFSRSQFLSMWATEADAEFTGRLLAVLPEQPQQFTPNQSYFTRSPARQINSNPRLPPSLWHRPSIESGRK